MLNATSCTCNCADGYSGESCESESQTGLSIESQINGLEVSLLGIIGINIHNQTIVRVEAESVTVV